MMTVIRFVLFVAVVNLASTKVFANDLTILALGDSLSAGYGLNQGEGFPEQLSVKINNSGNNIKIINAGVSGDTTQGGLARLGWALVDNPDMVILELGANDGLRAIDPELTFNNLDQIITQLKARNIKILLAGMMAPPNLGEEYGKAFNSIYPRLAQKHKVTLYPFFLDGVAGIPDLNLEDGIHPTKEGIGVIVDRILPFVMKVLEK